MTHQRTVLAVSLVAALVLGACGSDDSSTIEASAAPSATVTEIQSETTVTTATDEATASPDAEQPADAGTQAPPRPEGGPPDAAGDAAGENSLATGPTNVGEHGPLSNADFDGNEEVTREELDTFIEENPQREIGLVAFFAESDSNGDDVLDEDELAVVDPPTAFNGTDADDDGQVTLAEADAYANEEGRTYRAIGLSAFFDLVDTNGDDVADADEIEAAHESGLLARG